MNYLLCATRLSVNSRAVLISHIDALTSKTAEPVAPRSPKHAQAIVHLERLGLIRLCNRDDGPPMPHRTVLTDNGRRVLSELLMILAEQYTAFFDSDREPAKNPSAAWFVRQDAQSYPLLFKELWAPTF